MNHLISFASRVVHPLDLKSVAITSDMLQPLVEGISSNIAVILPVGITIFAIFIGVAVVPKIIKKFMGA